MATAAVEDYVKAIYLAAESAPEKAVAMGEVARALGVAPGTATTMVKSLSDQNLVAYEARVGVRLTGAGQRLALSVLRRHRLVELFLVEKLGLDWNEIHVEAERLEHALSDRVLEALDAFLGRPKVDPHGDPIPSATGVVDQRVLLNLRTAPLDVALRVARVVDQEASFLTFAQENGLVPGAEIQIRDRRPASEAATIRLGTGKEVTLGLKAAEKIFVEDAPA